MRFAPRIVKSSSASPALASALPPSRSLRLPRPASTMLSSATRVLDSSSSTRPAGLALLPHPPAGCVGRCAFHVWSGDGVPAPLYSSSTPPFTRPAATASACPIVAARAGLACSIPRSKSKLLLDIDTDVLPCTPQQPHVLDGAKSQQQQQRACLAPQSDPLRAIDSDTNTKENNRGQALDVGRAHGSRAMLDVRIFLGSAAGDVP
ncbi:hypothetical protein B0H15DRAFT_944253 [Mycena belliarum]|uniref:Uncharacterized protein n=1 Tax=Mycena belliarum TaxID=1033014 RepID=A0AAD6UF39_9AGAR|nr:hypothetical protein B0H15DRAFT_944253 [Mycena belliae]